MDLQPECQPEELALLFVQQYLAEQGFTTGWTHSEGWHHSQSIIAVLADPTVCPRYASVLQHWLRWRRMQGCCTMTPS